MSPRRRLPALVVLLLAIASLATPAQARRSPRDSALRFDRGSYARIPFDLRGQHVWIRGAIGTSDSVWIVVDTGSSASVMDGDLARRLGLAAAGRHQAQCAPGPQTGGMAADVTIRLPGLSLHRDRFRTLPLGAVSAAGGRPMQVILGHELFASCVVRFDYASGIMEVWDAAHPPKDRSGVEVPITFEDNLPYVEGTLILPGRAPLRGRFVIDTGSGAALMLSPEVVDREQLSQAFPRTLETLALGVGGELRNRMGRAEAFSIGPLRFDGPIVLMPQEKATHISARGTIGNIGGPLLRRCRVTFDYGRRRMRLEPGPEFGQPFQADMSGATIRRDASGWSVRLVNPDTPAAEAGLREGDVVTRVDDQPAERVDQAAFRTLMQTEGRTVRIGIRRGQEESTATLVLRRIL